MNRIEKLAVILFMMCTLHIVIESITATSALSYVARSAIELHNESITTEKQIAIEKSKPNIYNNINFDNRIDYDKYSSTITNIFGVNSNYLKNKIYKESRKNNLNPFMVAALITAESDWRSREIGKEVTVYVYKGNDLIPKKTRAYGLMQILDIHHPAEKLLRPEYNITAGTRILGGYKRYTGGNTSVLLKNYNSGPNSKYYDWGYINKIKKLMGLCEESYKTL